MNPRFTEDLVKSAKQIREKFRALKRGKYIDEEQRVEMFKPFTDLLQKLALNKADEITAEPQKIPHRNLARIATPSKIPAIQDRPAPLPLQFGTITANYLKNKKITDTTYGLRRIHEDPDNFYIGNEIVEIAKNDITVGDTIYKGTEGLWELLTLKKLKSILKLDWLIIKRF